MSRGWWYSNLLWPCSTGRRGRPCSCCMQCRRIPCSRSRQCPLPQTPPCRSGWGPHGAISILRHGIVSPAQSVVSNCMWCVKSRSGHTLRRDSTRGAHALLERANVCRTIAGMLYMPTARVKSLEALVQFKVAERRLPVAVYSRLCYRPGLGSHALG